MTHPITANLNLVTELFGREQKQVQNTQFRGYVHPTWAHHFQNVMNGPGYVSYQEGNQMSNQPMYKHVMGYNSDTPPALQSNQMSPYPYAPYPVFYNPYAYTTFVQNHIYQQQTNQLELTQHALTPNAPPPGAELTWMNWMNPALPGAAPPKNQISSSKVGALSHPELHPFNPRKRNLTSSIPKQLKKYQCSRCKKTTVKVILKRKGPENWMCVKCYNRDYNRLQREAPNS